jgi:hypothetical protein
MGERKRFLVLDHEHRESHTWKDMLRYIKCELENMFISEDNPHFTGSFCKVELEPTQILRISTINSPALYDKLPKYVFISEGSSYLTDQFCRGWVRKIPTLHVFIVGNSKWIWTRIP